MRRGREVTPNGPGLLERKIKNEKINGKHHTDSTLLSCGGRPDLRYRRRRPPKTPVNRLK